MSDELPSAAGRIAREYPEIWRAYQQLGAACGDAGPLDTKTRHLLKIAVAMTARSEGATHSHVRRALADGLTAEEIRHAALLLAPTVGFPQAVAALTWAEDELGKDG
jgi:alkylhydroperoxidase/carboxymuconolactone decarboxylase family protein YurZ